MYDLSVDGLTAFKGAGILARKRYFRQPLAGVLDGVNARFTGQFAPWDSGDPPAVYLADALLTPTAQYAVDYVAGAVTLITPPASDVPVADYTQIEAIDDEIVAVLVGGFDELVRRLNVGWALFNDGTHTYVSDSEASAVDPTVNGRGFSADRQAKRAFLLCCHYAYLREKAAYTALHNKSIRAGDLAVNSQRNPDQIRELLQTLDDEIARALGVLSVDADGESYGAYLGPLESEAYKSMYKWQGKTEQAVDGEV